MKWLAILLLLTACSKPADQNSPSTPVPEEVYNLDQYGIGFFASSSTEFSPYIDMSSVVQGKRKSISVTIKNDSASPTLALSPSLSDDKFYITSSTCSNRVIPARSSCSLTLNFSAIGKSAQIFESTLQFGLSSIPVRIEVSPAQVSSGSGAVIKFYDGSVEIASGYLGSASASLKLSKLITIKNEGSSATLISDPTLSSLDFYLSSNSCANIILSAGDSCSVSVNFSAVGKTVGDTKNTLLIFGGAQVPLSASVALPPSPPASQLVFMDNNTPLTQDLHLGVYSTIGTIAKTLSIKNVGSIRTQDLSLELLNNSSSFYVISNACDHVSLAAGASCSFVLRTSTRGKSAGVHSVTLRMGQFNQVVDFEKPTSSPPISSAYAKNCSEARSRGLVNLENNTSSGNYTIDPDDSGPIAPFSVYCVHESPTLTYTEVFNLSREPNLTDQEVLDRMNKFTTTPLVLSNLSRDPLRDGVEGVSWHNSSNEDGLSYGLNKVDSGGFLFSARRVNDPFKSQGALSLHSVDRTGCSRDWYTPTGCFTYANRNLFNQIIFTLFDATKNNGSPWNLIHNGSVSSLAYEQTLTDQLIDTPFSKIYLTSYGRYNSDEGENYPARVYFTKLYLKDLVILPSSCPQAKANGVLNLAGTRSSGLYVLDSDGINNGYEPQEIYCDMSGLGQALTTSSCQNAKLYGQRSVNNTFASGLYLLDLDGVGTGEAPTQLYCDMSAPWDSTGGYTLVGAFNVHDSSPITPLSIVNLSDSNVYLSNDKYVSLLSKSQELIFRSSRGDASEVIFKVNKADLSLANCNSNLTSIAPSIPYGAAVKLWAWVWREGDCNLNGGDYTILGIRNDGISQYYNYGLSNLGSLSYLWDNGTGVFNLTPPVASFEKQPSEKFYIFLK